MGLDIIFVAMVILSIGGCVADYIRIKGYKQLLTYLETRKKKPTRKSITNSSISINGMTWTGDCDTIEVKGNRMYVDGKDVTNQAKKK